jgi:hypothetical protein
MAQTKTDPTTPKAVPSNWLPLKDVFGRWRDRLGSSKDAKDALEALLRDPETRSRKRRVDTSGEETPDTLSFLNAQFWKDLAHLSLMPDADGGDDHLVVNYTDHADVYLDVYLPDGYWEYSVRRLDVERWERLYPELAAPEPAPSKEPTLAPAPSEELSNSPRRYPKAGTKA